MPYKTKKPPEEPKDFLGDIISNIRQENNLESPDDKEGVENEDGLVDVMTFCEREDLLDLPGNNLYLFRSQKVMLKALYMGSKGNEKLKLDEDDWHWLYDKQQVPAITKLKRKTDGVSDGEAHNFNFRELNLACGRRGSKTLIASVICAYEAYKLLRLKDPYKYYGIPYDEEIAILNVANSGEQAKRLFSQIKARIRNSPFFTGRVQGDGDSQSKIRLYTDVDLKKKESGNANIKVEGSVVLVCGHSNPDSLRGYSAICILFDELQYYDEHPVVSGRDFYNALTPSLSLFAQYGDGYAVELSTTGTPTGIFYGIHNQAMDVGGDFDKVLGFHLSTWDMNEKIPYDGEFLSLKRKQDPESFNVEYGAQWSAQGLVSIYFPEELVRQCIKPDINPMVRRIPEFEFFMHIDPAATHDNYTIAIVYRQKYVTATGDKRYRVILAFHKTWKPMPGVGLDLVDLDNQTIEIARAFKPRTITYDTWNSVHSINFFKNKGIHAMQLSFGRGPKSNYYQNLYDLMNRGELFIYGDDAVVGELMGIRYRPTMRGTQIFPDPKGEIKTDDIVDCVAGASWMAVGRRLKAPLPRSVLVNIGRW